MTPKSAVWGATLEVKSYVLFNSYFLTVFSPKRKKTAEPVILRSFCYNVSAQKKVRYIDESE